MTFWATNFSADATLKDPKRKFRFLVTLGGLNSDGGQLWYAKTANKPSFAIAAAEHKYLNHTFYYPGSVTWNDVVITLVDPVKPDSTATLAGIVQAAGYKPPTSPTSTTTMSKASAANAMGTVTVQQIAGDGSVLETWTLWNAFVIDLKFGDLEYGGDDLTELSMTLKYDWAQLEVATEGSDATADTGKKFFAVNS
mgnify:CR=1 FL=1|jgi:hypothetical protein